jgi:hypothetical protein
MLEWYQSIVTDLKHSLLVSMVIINNEQKVYKNYQE